MWFSHKLSYKIVGCLKGKAHPGRILWYFFRDSGNHSPVVRVPGSYLATMVGSGPLLPTLAQGWEPLGPMCLIYLDLYPVRSWKMGHKSLSVMWSFLKTLGWQLQPVITS